MGKKAKEEEKPKIRWGRPGNTLKMGLVGLPNVGKSTTFNTLTKCNVPAENYPFCTIDPSEAVVPVPDKRFDDMCAKFKPKSEVAAVIKIMDIAGLVPGAHKGEGLGNAFLANIRGVDGIYHVCRCFSGDENGIVHTEDTVDPARDIKIIQNELIMKDREMVDKNVIEFTRKVEQNRKLKEIADELESLKKAQALLESGKQILDSQDWTAKDVDFLNKYQFLTAKPCTYLCNMSEKDFVRQKNKHLPAFVKWVMENGGGQIIPYSAELEEKLVDMGPEDALDYMKEQGKDKAAKPWPVESMLPKIIQGGYSCLNLQHFFTCGPDEVRCWTVQKGWKAPQAAGVIHGDMERGFICMETYSYNDLIEFGTEAEVKSAGKQKQQGKNYEMQDGDICFVKFNVTTAKK